MKRFLICVIVMALCAVLCSTTYGGGLFQPGDAVSISLGSDYETFQAKLIYSPDPNGGIGVVVMGDSFVPQDSTWENLAIGPTLRFNLGDLAAGAVDRLLPGSWSSLSNAPMRVYGVLDFLWETDNGEFTFAPGTQFVFFPDWVVSPFVQLTYFKPVGDSNVDEDFKAVLGGEYKFR